MVDETKVRVMTRLAAYEEGTGKKYLPIGQYFRTDYIWHSSISRHFSRVYMI